MATYRGRFCSICLQKKGRAGDHKGPRSAPVPTEEQCQHIYIVKAPDERPDPLRFRNVSEDDGDVYISSETLLLLRLHRVPPFALLHRLNRHAAVFAQRLLPADRRL